MQIKGHQKMMILAVAIVEIHKRHRHEDEFASRRLPSSKTLCAVTSDTVMKLAKHRLASLPLSEGNCLEQEGAMDHTPEGEERGSLTTCLSPSSSRGSEMRKAEQSRRHCAVRLTEESGGNSRGQEVWSDHLWQEGGP